jgi:thymidylate synthase
MDNKLDQQYQTLLQTILDFGVEKKDRTGTGTKSIFGYTIRHNMKDGFPLLTTKKMAWKTMVTELLWFLTGDTNIKYLVDNNCHIWDGDCFANYIRNFSKYVDSLPENGEAEFIINKDKFINKIKTDNEFAKKWGELGPIYGKQWRKWNCLDEGFVNLKEGEEIEVDLNSINISHQVDQIAYLISELKTNPDSRRLMVNAWNVGELDQMVLPPCHYGFQVYTRELSLKERYELVRVNGLCPKYSFEIEDGKPVPNKLSESEWYDKHNIPTRAISLMWNQRSVDTFLGLPFNIASYGLLLEIIAKAVNMVPDELIGNLGDVHLYSNHIEQAKEQIGKISWEERKEMLTDPIDIREFGNITPFTEPVIHYWLNYKNIPYSRRMPYPLPTLNINTEFWPTESGECGIGAIDAIAVFNGFSNDHFCKCLLEEDLQLANYQSHPTIKAPLSN